jgi:hypothetical protein
MARFSGKVGYGEPVESSPGVWNNAITERPYFGDVVRNSRNLNQPSDAPQLNDNISVGNSISIVADAYAREHFHLIKYVEWSGSLWTVDSVEVRAPRLILSLGTVYNGPTP